MPVMNKPIIFLDRDGTLIAERGYLGDSKGVKILPHVLSGLRKLQKNNYPLVIVSNQSGVARGFITRKQVESVNQTVLRKFTKAKIQFDGVYWCPHEPKDQCVCRKPKPFFLRKAARHLRRSLAGCISIGDRASDVQLAQNVKGKGILLLTGYGKKNWTSWKERRKPDFVARNFKEVVAWILKQS
jgi:histidinol-phosphate phosphatase family protein